MKNVNVRKLALAGILVAVGIVCSPLSIPVGASKCAPVQHFINILAGVFLGPGYGVGMAFVTSLLRNLMGTGTLLAFPGSMCGAFLCGMLYKYGKHLPFAYAGELFGTSVIGGLLSYPVATLIMGSESAVFGFVIPFFVSSFGGTIIAAVLVTAMKKMKVFDIYLGNLDADPQHAGEIALRKNGQDKEQDKRTAEGRTTVREKTAEKENKRIKKKRGARGESGLRVSWNALTQNLIWIMPT